MSVATQISDFVDSLADIETPAACNFYSNGNPANATRRQNLKLYLQEVAKRKPSILLLGEAPGYQGSRMSGVPFTSEHIMLTGVDGLEMLGAWKGYQKTDESGKIHKEPTATIMWEVLNGLQFAPLLWAAFPFHPHQPGEPLTNRVPTKPEVELGKDIFQQLMSIFGIRHVVAVGNVAHNSLAQVGIDTIKVRHPSHGGKNQFKSQLTDFVQQLT